MAHYGHIIIFSLIGGVVSLIGGLILLSKKSWAENLAKYATPFAAGALLAAVFTDLLKEAVVSSEASSVFLYCLVGILVFFLAERFLRWFHHHHTDEEGHHSDATAGLVIAGDTLHNALDGVVIAASFLVSIPTGIVTTMAVAAHEIPQEIGDFGLLLKKGLSRRKVIMVNILSALATTATALLTFWIGADRLPIGALLGLSAGFLLYIAMSDIIPSIHDDVEVKKLFDIRPLLLVLGVVVVSLSVNIAHQYIGGHSHAENESHAHEALHDSDHHH